MDHSSNWKAEKDDLLRSSTKTRGRDESLWEEGANNSQVNTSITERYPSRKQEGGGRVHRRDRGAQRQADATSRVGPQVAVEAMEVMVTVVSGVLDPSPGRRHVGGVQLRESHRSTTWG